VEPAERVQLERALAVMRRRAAYWLERLSARPEAASLLSGLAARGRALDACIRAAAELDVAETRLAAEYSAAEEAQAADPNELARLEGRRLSLAERRARLDAQLPAEYRAFGNAERLLFIRLGPDGRTQPSSMGAR